MSKVYNIRWNQSDSKELAKAVKNFNAKITRLEKKDPKNKNSLPERVSVREMKELITTRQDLNRELNALKRFTERGSETLVIAPGTDYNLKITKWQKQEMTRRVGIINRKRKQKLEEISDIEMVSRGQKLGYSRGELGMGTLDENALKPMKAFTRKMTRADLNMKWKNIMLESQGNYWREKEQRMMNNYLNALRTTYNEEDVADVIDAIERMDYKKFRKIFEAEGGTFEFVSDPPDLNEKYQQYVNALHSMWTPKKANVGDAMDKVDVAGNLKRLNFKK